MSNTKWTVCGRRFTNRIDYEAALRDKARIDTIRQKFDMKDPNSIMNLYQGLQASTIQFESVVGRDFDDEVFELTQKIKKGEFETVSPENKKTKKQKPKKTKKKNDRQDVKVIKKSQYRMQKVFRVALLLIAIGCLSYFGYYSYFVAKSNAEIARMNKLKENEGFNSMINGGVKVYLDNDVEKEYEILEKYKSLYNSNKNLIGWIKIDDTLIDYPVMQTVDNEYYLDHDLNQKTDKNGSLFLDKDCSIIKPSTNLIIYGHHMKSGKMFGDLSKYKKESFYKKHNTITFDTIHEEGVYEIMYVFYSKIYYEEEIVFKYYQFIDCNSEAEFNSNMNEMAQMSLYDTGVTAEYGDRLLTLSTCDYQEADGRFVVVAKKIS